MNLSTQHHKLSQHNKTVPLCGVTPNSQVPESMVEQEQGETEKYLMGIVLNLPDETVWRCFTVWKYR